MIIGGKDAKTPVEGIGIDYVKEASQWNFTDIEKFSNDILITSYLKRDSYV